MSQVQKDNIYFKIYFLYILITLNNNSHNFVLIYRYFFYYPKPNSVQQERGAAVCESKQHMLPVFFFKLVVVGSGYGIIII